MWDYWPSGDEPYDVEALYFDNDAENVYIAIVTSVAPYSYVGGGVQGWGVYESRPPFSASNGFWIPGSDLAISLMKGTPRNEEQGTQWYYNYGLNIAHENRDLPFTGPQSLHLCPGARLQPGHRFLEDEHGPAACEPRQR